MTHTKTTWTPKTWTDPHHPAPRIPVLDGLRFDQYEAACLATIEYLGEQSGHVNPLYRAVISDPGSDRYAVVTAGFGECPRMWISQGETVTMTTHPCVYSFDLHKTAAHQLTWLAFREASDTGTLEQYWAS